MTTTETTTAVHARHTHNRDRLMYDGVTGTEPDYGTIEIVRTVTTIRRADGNVGRVLGTPVKRDDVLATLTANQATHLIATIGDALTNSLKVRPGYKP
jgi:hypothetical protein